MNGSSWQKMIHAISRLNQIVVLELLRRKDLSVVATLVIVFSLFAILFRIAGIENDSTATFVLNLGLDLVHYATHTLVILVACRQLPDEIEKRTVYPLLAKPVRREWVILSRVLSIAACGMAVWIVLGALCWIVAPKREAYDPALLVQMGVVSFASIGMVTSMTVFLSLALSRYLAVTTSPFQNTRTNAPSFPLHSRETRSRS